MQGAYGDKNGTQLVDQGSSNYKYPHNPICTEPRADGELTGGKYDPSHEYGIAFAEWPRAVVTGEYTIPGPANDKRACDIKCVYCESGRNSSNNHSGNQYIVEAYRKLDFVVHQELYMKAGPIYSDIVLPVTSLLEMDFAYAFRTQSELCIVGTQVVPQYYECKDDVEIVFMLRDALGFGEDDLPYYTCRQAMFDMLANTTVAMDDGENREPLVSITSDDLSTHGFEGEPQEGRVPFSEFIQNGIYEFMRKPDDNHMNVWLEDFRKDPEANPVKTATGKLELYSQALVDYYKACQFHDIDAIPKYKPMVDGYEQIPQDPDYKYQMVTPHHNRQVHSTNSSNKQLNEVFPNDLKMNVFDAQRDGFKAGDWVLVSGRNAGKIVRRIKVVPYVAPGTILLGEGNWVDIDHDTGIDMGGNVNILTRPQLLGDGYQAYNTVLLKIEPYTGTQLLPDYRRPYKVPLAE
jgi:anaerobic dimethyl sulfoxide reductase subunit A